MGCWLPFEAWHWHCRDLNAFFPFEWTHFAYERWVWSVLLLQSILSECLEEIRPRNYFALPERDNFLTLRPSSAVERHPLLTSLSRLKPQQKRNLLFFFLTFFQVAYPKRKPLRYHAWGRKVTQFVAGFLCFFLWHSFRFFTMRMGVWNYCNIIYKQSAAACVCPMYHENVWKTF